MSARNVPIHDLLPRRRHLGRLETSSTPRLYSFLFVTLDGRGAGAVGDLNVKDGSRESVVGRSLGNLISTTPPQHFSSPIVPISSLRLDFVSNYIPVRRAAVSTLNQSSPEFLAGFPSLATREGG
ncbi:hypothetical protein JAAARDRAFT_197253 [Jaapia argillacea MUCL 33604]|uniref:Uncharacterized protein n=1 Tax=Jaapia argillacea MUCL 33604 TaxID=933084 RepID=A0A067PR82_9AGAM|nr:hypothetical protein JAAARDRAFT_197253 [Jaapia argillacea MUCL 33604]